MRIRFKSGIVAFGRDCYAGEILTVSPEHRDTRYVLGNGFAEILPDAPVAVEVQTVTAEVQTVKKATRNRKKK